MKKRITIISISIILVIISFSISFGGFAMAETESDTDSQNIQTRGLAVSISLSIDGGNGEVRAKAKNDFTLFPATVEVVLYLYSSKTHQPSYGDMTLVSTTSIADLDMGKSIETSAPTNGESLYWMARVRYKMDNKQWKSKSTSCILCDAQGDMLKRDWSYQY